MPFFSKLGIKFGKLAAKFSVRVRSTKWAYNMSKTAHLNTASAAGAISGAGAKVGAGLLTWGNLFKITIVGGLGYLFFTGGLPSAFSAVTGLPEWVSQLVIAGVIVFVVLSLVRLLMYRFRRSMYLFKGQGPGRY